MSGPETRVVRPALFDPFRLLFGTLTVLPVQPPRVVNRVVAGRAMTLAPVAGIVLALLVGVPLQLAWRWGHGSSALLAVLVVGALAVLTRAMHLDGLADVADGLGSGRRGDDALAIMKKSDIGPFGVATLVLVLLVQVVALSDLVATGRGFAAVVVALVASRTMLPVLCGPRFRAARPGGLGAAVSGSVSTRGVAVALALAIGLVLAATGLFGIPGWMDPPRVEEAVLAALGGTACGHLLAWRAVSRFGGTTGDVYGAVVETTFTATLALAAFFL
ncbi:adenosylcobinamide-GDP ribazoletransferase [Nocardioides jiangxiensis]|uniref:Adenosylcobinamide-GDP ribazoletransferase n=1 Tax=Nocardioides jiangxiensis TaxID=3064524 RepID=A0ABT9AWX9_9ACTN|nr:adenosylcobinamide-GDP ribazoletransferase [Nocardioides sp. WY-20]MDO7867005.1 adenosylcobinamide-GDP ribazoletransferase [Nocardioides sp. WY-20]